MQRVTKELSVQLSKYLSDRVIIRLDHDLWLGGDAKVCWNVIMFLIKEQGFAL